MLTAESIRADADPKRSRFTVGKQYRICDEWVVITDAVWRDDDVVTTWTYKWKGDRGEPFPHGAPQVLSGLVPLSDEEWMAIGRDQERAVTERRFQEAVNTECVCGGGQGTDPQCTACAVWHDYKRRVRKP